MVDNEQVKFGEEAKSDKEKETVSTTETEEQTSNDQTSNSDESSSEPNMKKSDMMKIIQGLQKDLDETKKNLEQQNAQYLRVVAEYDNFRKRTQKEKENLFFEACLTIVSDVLPIKDTLEKASGFTDPQSVSKGLEMIMNSIDEFLSKNGVTEIKSEGASFDPNLHDAVAHGQSDELGENTISDVFRKGYIKGDRVIRHAMVKVVN